MDWSHCPAVNRRLERLSGAWCCKGTRLPVTSLFDYLDRGSSVDEFVESLPDVSPEQVHQVLAFAKRSLEQPALA